MQSVPSFRTVPNDLSPHFFEGHPNALASTMMDESDTSPPLRRTREQELTVKDMMYKARIIFGCDPYKDRAPTTEDKKFRALFGCSPVVVLALWSLLVEHCLVPEGGKLIHLFWALLFVKVYPTEETLTVLCSDPTGIHDCKTIRKWIRLFMTAVSYLTDVLVSS